MNLLIKKTLFFLVLLILSTNVFAQKIKVAFIGNSITVAHHITWYDPGYEAYSDIAALLIKQYFGDVADVQNFGDGGKTLVDKIDPKTGLVYDGSYMRQPTFTNALNFAPDICFISLGTNDGTTSSWPNTPGNRGYVTEFYGDYLTMIDSFKFMNPKTYFVLCYPPPIFGVNFVYDDAMAIKMRPEIDKVVAHFGADSLDWHTLLKGKAALFSDDRIHPKASGSALMGKFAFDKILSSDLLNSKMIGSSLALNKPVAVSASIGSNSGDKAVDIDKNSGWESSFTGQSWISADLGLVYNTSIIRLAWAESQSKDYQLQVSDNNTDWTTIKTVVGDTSRIAIHKNMIGSGRYVRVLLTNLNGLSFKLNELEVFGTLHLAGDNITQKGGMAFAQYTATDTALVVAKAVDTHADTKFQISRSSTWLEYAASGYYKLNGYTVTTGNNDSSKDPIKWILEGSKDNSTWVPLDSVGYDKNVTFQLRYEKKYYQISDTTQYAFFRLNMTSATSVIQIGEWELFGDFKSAVLPSYLLTLASNPVSMSSKLIGSTSYWETKKVQIIAGVGSGYLFNGWTGSAADIALLADPTNDTTTFIMPNRNITLTANYKRGTDINSVESSLIKIVPNPVKNVLTIIGLPVNAVVSIYNTAGVKMKIKAGAETNVAGLPKGTYLVSIVTPQGVVKKTFLKE